MQNTDSAPSPDRLPCRGCTMDCPNRNRCDGKPWRIPRESDKPVTTH